MAPLTGLQSPLPHTPSQQQQHVAPLPDLQEPSSLSSHFFFSGFLEKALVIEQALNLLTTTTITTTAAAASAATTPF